MKRDPVAVGSTAWMNRRFSRRQAMRGGLVMLSGGVLVAVGCSSSSNNSGNAAKATSSATTAGTVARPAGSPATGGATAAAARAGSPAAGAATNVTFAPGKPGGNIVFIIGDDPTGLDPHTSQGGDDHRVFWTIHDNLVNYDQNGSLDPSQSLAQSWEIANGTQITFHLRPNIKFHDGTPLDAAAIKFNIDRQLDPALKAASFAVVSAIDSVQVVDPMTVVFKLKAPNAALLTNLGDRAGTVVSPAAAQKFGKDLTRNPVGTGPFVFKEWVQSDHITVTKNPNYWAKDSAGTSLPYLDQLRYNIVKDPTVALANLDAGTADVLPLQSAQVDDASKNPKYGIATVKGAGWSGVYANQALSPLDDVHFRRALGHSIDKAAIGQAVFFNKGQAGLGPIGPALWAFNPNLKGLDFDLTAAKQELAQSKNPNGGKTEIITINGAPYLQHTELWKAMAAKAGIDLTVTPLATADLTNRDYVLKDAPLNLAGFSGRADPDGLISDVIGSMGFYNPGHQPNPQLDDLISKALQTYDQNQRKSFYDQIQQIAIDQVYDYYVYYTNGYSAAQSKVKNLNSLYGPEGKQRFKWLYLG